MTPSNRAVVKLKKPPQEGRSGPPDRFKVTSGGVLPVTADACLHSSSRELFKSSEKPFDSSLSARGFSFKSRPEPLTLPMTRFSLRLPRRQAFMPEPPLTPCIQTQAGPPPRRDSVHSLLRRRLRSFRRRRRGVQVRQSGAACRNTPPRFRFNVERRRRD